MKMKENVCLRQYVPSVYVSILLERSYAKKICILHDDQT